MRLEKKLLVSPKINGKNWMNLLFMMELIDGVMDKWIVGVHYTPHLRIGWRRSAMPSSPKTSCANATQSNVSKNRTKYQDIHVHHNTMYTYWLLKVKQKFSWLWRYINAIILLYSFPSSFIVAWAIYSCCS